MALVLALVMGLAIAGCGAQAAERGGVPAALLAQARPIGAGPRFRPPVRDGALGPCRARLAHRYAAHVELFAAGRVVLISAGIGTQGSRRFRDGRLVQARCYGEVVTLDPTGVVLVRPGSHARLGELFQAWGQPLSARRVASFRAAPGGSVVVFVAGRRWPGAPATVPLTSHAEVVIEVGPFVPPHGRYTFPPGE